MLAGENIVISFEFISSCLILENEVLTARSDQPSLSSKPYGGHSARPVRVLEIDVCPESRRQNAKRTSKRATPPCRKKRKVSQFRTRGSNKRTGILLILELLSLLDTIDPGYPLRLVRGLDGGTLWMLETTKGSPGVGSQEPSEITHPRNKSCTADERNF